MMHEGLNKSLHARAPKGRGGGGAAGVEDKDYDEEVRSQDEFEDADGDDERDDDNATGRFEAINADELEDDVEDGDDELEVALKLSPKEQGARALAIRRALEERDENRRLKEDLGDLDLDFEDL